MAKRKFSAPPGLLLLHPPYLCMLLYRVAHFFWRRGYGKVARLFTQVNSLVTGVDIHPHTDLGGGVLIPHPVAVTVSGHAGSNFTMMPLSGIGMLPRSKDVGAGPGLPILGDDVWLGPGCGVIGPLRVGNRSRVAAGAAVTRDVGADNLVESVARAKLVSSAASSGPLTKQNTGGRAAESCGHGRWMRTWQHIRADVERYMDVRDPRGVEPRGAARKLSALLSTEVLVVATSRLAHFFWCNGHARLANLLSGLNQLLNRATIGAESCIGPRMFLGHPAGIVLHGTAGAELTMYARSLCMPRRATAKCDLPYIGDRFVLAGMAAVFGPVRIGNDVRVGFCIHLGEDIADNRSVAGDVMSSHVTPLAGTLPPREPRANDCEPARVALPLAATRARMREDRLRLRAEHGGGAPLLPLLCVLLHRLSHHFERRGQGRLARWLWRINVAISGADIDPRCDIGGGLVIPNPVGISICAHAGRNLTVRALSFVGPESAGIPEPDRLGAMPRLGNDVVIGEHVFICGEVRVGSGVRLEAGVRVMADIDAGTTLAMPPARVHARRAEISRLPSGTG